MKAVFFRIVGKLALTCVLTENNLCVGQSWTQTSAPFTTWSCVASSADGSKLVAAVNGGYVYTSTNSGFSWTRTSAPSNSWTSVACSANGAEIFAASALLLNSPIYHSADSGTSWAPTDQTGVTCLACSADGVEVAGAAGGVVAVSTNSAATWMLLRPPAADPEENISLVACSSDGSELAVVETFIGSPLSHLAITPSSVWEERYVTSAPPYVHYTAVAVSERGTGLAAALNNLGDMVVPPATNCGGTMGMLFTSRDGGASGIITCTSMTNWTAIASSADGMRLIAAAADGAIYTSVNGGTNWQSEAAPNANWSGVASSADGCKLVAVANGGGIYTWQTTPTLAVVATSANGALLISWIIPSIRFVLQQNSSLNSTNWTDLSASVALNLANLQEQVTIPAPTAPTFYRLRSQ